MRRQKTQKLNSSQKTVWYYPEEASTLNRQLQKQHRYFELLQCHILIEDVYTQIFPVGGRSKKNPLKIHIAPNSESIESLVASALNSRDRGSRNELASSVADFFHGCAQSLMIFGEAVYEIVYLSNPDDHKILEFEFQKVLPFTLKRRHGRLVQIVPREVVERRGVPSSIDLPAERILIFRPPASIQRSIPIILDSLAILSEKLVPEFALKDFRQATTELHFDSAGQVYTQKLALAEAGKVIGWNARGLFEKEMLEFYSLSRQLSFERFKIDLRTSILDTLNEGLGLAGSQMGFEAQIIVEGLPTISDVEFAQSELEAGSSTFGDILKPFLFY
jgi:hypothetical protein